MPSSSPRRFARLRMIAASAALAVVAMFSLSGGPDAFAAEAAPGAHYGRCVPTQAVADAVQASLNSGTKGQLFALPPEIGDRYLSHLGQPARGDIVVVFSTEAVVKVGVLTPDKSQVCDELDVKPALHLSAIRSAIEEAQAVGQAAPASPPPPAAAPPPAPEPSAHASADPFPGHPASDEPKPPSRLPPGHLRI